MKEEMTGMANKRNGKYLTAAILTAFVVGLFVFTLYTGLK